MTINLSQLLVILPLFVDSVHAQNLRTKKVATPRNLQVKPYDEADARVDAQIVGGTPVASAATYPYFAHYFDSNCGAVLVHDDIILTAASCEDDRHPFDMRYDFFSIALGQGFRRFAARQVVHPDFVSETRAFDFLLAKLNTTALVDTTSGNAATGAAVITLQRDNSIPLVDDNLKIMGFGVTTATSSSNSQVLLDATVQAVSDVACAAAYASSGLSFIPEVMLCSSATNADWCLSKYRRRDVLF